MLCMIGDNILKLSLVIMALMIGGCTHNDNKVKHTVNVGYEVEF